MGNAQSEEESKGTGLGGFLGLVGSIVVSVVCPPAAIVALPAGIVSHTYGMTTMVKYEKKPAEEKKKGNTGDFIGGIIQGTTLGGTMQAGVNYKDGDSRPHMHYCSSGSNPVTMREEKEIREKHQNLSGRVQQDKLNHYMETNFHKANITFDFIKNNYWYFHYKYSAYNNFNGFKDLNFSKLNQEFQIFKTFLGKYNDSLYCKSTYVHLSISELPIIIKKWQTHQNSNIKKAGEHLVKAVVYGLNALENAKPFMDEKDSYACAMYANVMDESFKNYCCEMKNALIELLQETKKAYNTGRQLAIMENTINDMYDEVAKFNAEKENPFSKKYEIYIDSEKYKLNIQQRADKVQEFLDKDFNTTAYHHNIYKMVRKINEMVDN
jgi:hypothetical protein